MINYKHLLAFVTVVRKKSFTLAAKELYMTQPAVSWQIKNLENEIDLIALNDLTGKAKPLQARHG